MHVTAGQTPRSEACLQKITRTTNGCLSPAYLWRLARRTASVPATSETPPIARVGSTSGALEVGLGTLGVGDVGAACAAVIMPSPTANTKNEYLRSFCNFLRSLSWVVGRHRTNQTLTARGFRLAGRPSALQNDATAKLRT
jgi:hypothetical protein